MVQHDTPLSYAGHLQLDRLLSCQERESERQGRPAHDEMLFIIVHQAYELWFKQILFELARIQKTFAGERIDDRDLAVAVHGVGRIAQIQRLLIQQLDVLETMTPLDFLDFRDVLVPASGFQSVQFRLIETRLGLRPEDRVNFEARPYDARLGEAERARLNAAAAEPSLLEQIGDWLERTPFIATSGYDFREVYGQAVRNMLEREADLARANRSLSKEEADRELDSIEAARARFEAILDPARHAELKGQGYWRLSAGALRAALFINLYRDEPALQLPFRLLGGLMDVDEHMTTWRYRHALMVQRMIGRKMGTGGSSGYDYLRLTAERHRVFGDLFSLSTYFIPRTSLPPLPEDVRRTLGYTYAENGAA